MGPAGGGKCSGRHRILLQTDNPFCLPVLPLSNRSGRAAVTHGRTIARKLLQEGQSPPQEE